LQREGNRNEKKFELKRRDGKMLRTFVIGGSGFVGRNLIAKLRRRGDEVRALARSVATVETIKQLGAKSIHGAWAFHAG
jgi:voltage-gated potassium channel Kch